MSVAKAMTDAIGTQGSKTTIAAAATSSSASLDCSSYVGIIVGMEVVFGGTPDGTALLEVLSSPDNSTWDTTPYKSDLEINPAAGLTLMQTERIDPEVKYIKIRVTNNDTADDIDVWAFMVGLSL